ncbi:MAG: FtsX-like permease family protein [Thermoanaerobaculaceae bacterium]
MSALPFLVGRYLLGLTRRTHVAVVSAISFVSLGLGAMALVLTLALLEGFQGTIREELRARGPHALLLPSSGSKLPDGPWLERLQERFAPLSFRRVTRGVGWLVSLGETFPAVIEVVPELQGVQVDRVLAARAALGAGARVTLISSVPMLSPLGPVPRQVTVTVDGVVHSAAGEAKGTVYVSHALAEQILPQGGREEVQVFCPPEVDPARASESLGPLPEGVMLRGFRELHRPLLAALGLEKLLIGVSVSLILLVASLNLLCNLTMLAAEKRADVAILQAMGMPPSATGKLFRTLGLTMGLLGGLGGTVLGWVTAVILHRTQAIPLPQGVFTLRHVPFVVTAESLFLVVAVTVSVAFAAAWLPARAAARQEVLEGLRGE